MKKTRPSFLTNRKRTVIALRLIMALAVAAQTLGDLSNLSLPTGVILVVYAASSIVLLFEKPAAFLLRVPEMLLFVFDIAVIVALMLLGGEMRSQFYVFFFLIILMAALVRSARATLLLAVLSAGAYAFAVGVSRPSELLELGLPARIALFFVTALFAGFLAEEVHETEGRGRRFEGFYRSLFEQSAEGLLVTAADGTVLEANPRARKMLGSDPVGKMVWKALALDGAAVARPDGEPHLPAPSPHTLHPFFTVNIPHSDGPVLTCEATLRSLSIEGETYRLLLLRDVGDIRKAQKRIADLERVSRLGHFVASITHEINNPLGVILGYAELLEESGLPRQEREYASYIREAGERCKKVVDSFLGQYRSKSFSPALVEAGEMVRGAARLMEFHVRYHLVKAELDVQENLPVWADAHQVEQLLINLISNAVKAMEGRATKTLRIRAAAGPEGVEISVSDNGCGIPPENLTKLFQRGFTSCPDGSGHGIGLALTKEIVARHGGRMSVESRVGEGSTFTVHLPLARKTDSGKFEKAVEAPAAPAA